MKPTLLLLCWLGPLWVMGQTPYDNVPRYDQVPGFKKPPFQRLPAPDTKPIPRSVILKLNPLMAVGPDGAVHGAVEVPMGRRGAWQGEFGYGAFRSLMNYDSESYTRKENWRARLQYRWYGEQVWASDRRRYWAVEGTYKQVNAVDNETLGRDCVYGNCSYFQLVQQPATRYVAGLFGKTGIMIPLMRSDGTYRFLLDTYAGIGVSYVWSVRQPLNLPQGGQYPTDYLFTTYPKLFTLDDRFGKSTQPNRALPDMQLGFTLGYRLKE